MTLARTNLVMHDLPNCQNTFGQCLTCLSLRIFSKQNLLEVEERTRIINHVKPRNPTKDNEVRLAVLGPSVSAAPDQHKEHVPSQKGCTVGLCPSLGNMALTMLKDYSNHRHKALGRNDGGEMFCCGAWWRRFAPPPKIFVYKP